MFSRSIRHGCSEVAFLIRFVSRHVLAVVALVLLELCGRSDPAFAARPSNADTAFRQVPLNPPSSGSGYVVNQGHSQWPLSLENPALIWPIGGIDSVLIASRRLQGVRINLDGSVTSSLPANTRANRIAVIVTANDGTDPLDYTFPLLFVSCTFGDGRTWGSTSLPGLFNTKDLAFGHDVRNWSNQVSPSQPLFVVKPPAPTTFEVFAGPGISGPDSVFFDIQSIDIPDTLRSATLSTVTFTSSSFFTTTTGLISGLVVWPQFQIVNTASNPILLQQQTDIWGTDAYGGYAYNDTLIGQHRTIGELGCFLTCLSMVNTFCGVAATPSSLNAYLQQRPDASGFTWRAVTRLTSVDGSAVTFDIVDTTSTIGPTFLVEDGRLAPRATISVTGVDPGGLTGSGTITQRFNGGLVSVGDYGTVYDDVNYAAASLDLSAGVWTAVGIRQKATAALVESTLARNTPAMLFTAVDAAGARHWVVGLARFRRQLNYAA